ncbi:MAG TPA: hypothetical protein DCP63_09270 [Bacteroidetes bacterium]|nr:hypothetical protein [Bacteroidota bacterium]
MNLLSRTFNAAAWLVLLATSNVYGQRGGAWEALNRYARQDDRSVDSAPEPKCGTSLLVAAFARWQQLEPMAKVQIARSLQRPGRHKSKLSPAGFFRIHYDTTGAHKPALLNPGGNPALIEKSHEQYIDSVAAVLDYCRRVEVEILGYSAPPTDLQQGGGDEYDVYVSDLGTGVFGNTWWTPGDLIESTPNQRFATYMEIDNDYLGHRTPGLLGLKVTVAHEFLHAIQVGSYGIWQEVPNFDFYFYELSSSWMEDVVYDFINDYHFDVRFYFERFKDTQNRSFSFTTYAGPIYYGYERSIWAHFLVRRYGQDVMKEIWTEMKSQPFLRSAAKILQRRGSSLESEFTLFSFWNYFTADRADSARFYPEGKYYSRFSPNMASNFNGFSTSVSTSAYPLSTQFYQFSLASDTVTAIVVNVEADAAVVARPTDRAFDLILSSSHPSSPFQKLRGGAMIGFSSTPAHVWRTLYLESSSRGNAATALEPSPNPLRIRDAQRLILPVVGTRSADAQITFLSGSLDAMFSQRYPIVDVFGNKLIYVPSRDLQERIPSGIYFVHAQCDDAAFQWKVAIVQ